MIIGFIVLAVTFGFWCAIASLLMGYGFLSPLAVMSAADCWLFA